MEWKSPRKIEEEVKKYKMERFKEYMQKVDMGELTRELAFAAFRDEVKVVFSDEAVKLGE